MCSMNAEGEMICDMEEDHQGEEEGRGDQWRQLGTEQETHS